MVSDTLKKSNIDVLVIDLELNGLNSIFDLKELIRNFPNTRVLIFSGLSEDMYASNAIKAGASGYLHKTSKLETLDTTIQSVAEGIIVINNSVKKNFYSFSNPNDVDKIYRKLSSREIEVLRYLINGKKNKEISKILGLNEKTISTYKLRLLQKLNVSNLVDLVNKAKNLKIV